MFGEENNARKPTSGAARKTYWRSVSWSDRSPSGHTTRTNPGSKGRSCLPPLSITRRSVEEWPRAGSDDLGEWPQNPATPKPLENSREFQLKKDKLAFFDKECSRIADHIYLGSEAVAKNREILRQNGITHVLNCVGFVCPEYFKSDLVYKTLWLQDSPSEDITSILYDVFDYFEEVREQNGRVLVHCCQGVSRSTSLVIAYLMWRDGQNFEDAFQYVKAARGVTNPNMGFACQLLQCQKRVHAIPVSPSSVLRMYRMAPHSPYDPLHLVPKMLSNPGPNGLDSRGAFIVHVPSAIYVWIGKDCNSVMADNARASASQAVRYERFQGPILIVEEGLEPLDFWDALVSSAPNFDSDKVKEELGGVGKKKVDAFDLDFEIFEKALCGGVVPPFPFSEAGFETKLPARESGWNRLRRKFSNGFMKGFAEASKLTSDDTSKDPLLSMTSPDGSSGSSSCNEMEPSCGPSTEPLLSVSSPLGEPASFSDISETNPNASSKFPSPSPSPSLSDNCIQDLDTCSLTESPVPSMDNLSSVSPHCASPDSFSCYSNTSPKCGSKSPSPSPSSGSSLFTYSPASSNWSDSSCLSSQPSPSNTEFKDSFTFKHNSLSKKTCLPCKGSSPSLAERRGSFIPPSLMLLPSVNEPAWASRSFGRSWSFSHYNSEINMMEDSETGEFVMEDFFELRQKTKESDLDLFTVENESNIGMKFENRLGKIHLESNDLIHKDLDLTHPVLFQWPSIEKVDMFRSGVLDSRSVFLLLSPNVNSGKSESKILYIWVGHDAEIEKGQDQSMEINNKSDQDRHAYWEKVGSSFLNQMGLPMDTPVQMVQEGKEPMKFLDHFNCFSMPQSKVSCHG